jgi:hypothetical protein
MAAKPRKKTTESTSFKIGDRVRLVRLDGSLSPEAVTVHDLWGEETSNRNASFWSGNCEQFTHTDLMKHEADSSPVVVPDGGVWYIARGNQMGWGRAQTIEGAVRNMQRQGKCSAYIVHRVSKWTQVDGMGSLSYPIGIEPVEVKKVGK